MHKLRQRLQREEGFTLIELLVVIVIIGILLAIAIPSYLGFKDRANKADAQANLRQAIPSAEAFYSDNNSYATMDAPAMKAYDSGLSPDVSVTSATAGCYVLKSTHGGFSYYVKGPGGTIVDTAPAACT
jgi:type IV pilus assembly protein PilA